MVSVMKTIYLLQFRLDELIAKHEYECFLSKLPYSQDELIPLNALSSDWNESDLLTADAVILGGSGDYLVSQGDIPEVTDAISQLARKLTKAGVPVLGVCFGSQILCHAFGGKVELDANNQETGVFEIELSNEASTCPIFRELPQSFHVVLGHKDHLTQLPEGAVHLGSSEKSPTQAFTLPGTKTYGFLFHPELDVNDLIWRLTAYAENYGVTEKKITDMRKEYNYDISHAIKAMQRYFQEIVEKR